MCAKRYNPLGGYATITPALDIPYINQLYDAHVQKLEQAESTQ